MVGNKYTTGRPDPGEKARNEASQQEGFNPDSDCYVYSIVFERTKDHQEFIYVGQVSGGQTGLRREISKKARHPDKISKPVLKRGKEVIASKPGGYEFRRVYGIQSYDDISKPELRYHEWRTRGEVILDQKSINALGGR